VRVAIELSGEHPTLPRAEALAAMAAERVEIRELTFGSRVLRLNATGPVERALQRLGLAHVVSEELVAGDFNVVRDFARSTDLTGWTFRVRARGLDMAVDAGALEGALGADFGRTGRVDLEHPKIDYRLLVGEEYILGRIVHRVNRTRLEAEKVARRPFSLPISLHPKLARALVNLARVPMGGTLLDPFCGTGGILLEAASLGLRPLGSDRMIRMVRGSRASLRRLSHDAGLLAADAGAPPLKSGRIDGIATDPPYGRAASTRGEPLPRLYRRAFAAFATAIPRGGHVAIVLPDEASIRLGEETMNLVEAHPMRVHRSLVRTFCVFAT
jgi:tRNA (guanine10-N2)-dimethyltransferase